MHELKVEGGLPHNLENSDIETSGLLKKSYNVILKQRMWGLIQILVFEIFNFSFSYTILDFSINVT